MKLWRKGHEAALATLDEAEERGRPDHVNYVLGQLIGALAAMMRPRKRRGG